MDKDTITYAIVHGPSGEILECFLESYKNAFNRANDTEHYVSPVRLTVVMVKGERIVGAIDHNGKLRKTHYDLPKTVYERSKY